MEQTHIDPAFELSDDVIYQEVDGKVVLLNIETSQYYGLNTMATEIFKLLLEERNGEAVIRKVCVNYDACEDTVRADLHTLVQRLQTAGLVTAATA